MIYWYLIRDWVSVFVGIVTAVVAVLTFLRARKLGGWRAFGLGASRKDAEVTERLNDLITETAPNVSPENRQYLLLKEYHSQGIAQSKISFWFSLIFATLGFAVIISGVLAFQADKEFSKQAASFITLIAGAIIDAVSGLFFVQSNKARELMSEFFDKLRADRKLEESLRLCNDITNPDLRDRLRTLIALNFSGVNPKNELLTSILGVESLKEENSETAQTSG
jgi:hypothetical protein